MQQALTPTPKLNYLQKLLLKCTDRDAYYELKSRIKREQAYRETISFYSRGPIIPSPPRESTSLSFKHSGNAGDIIYSLPCIRELTNGHPATLHLQLGVPMRAKHLPHPLNGVQLDKQMYEKLSPLLIQQPYIREVSIHQKNTAIDVDLDAFRDTPMPLDRLAISRWYFFMTGITADLSKPWISAEPDKRFRDTVIIARSFRYRNPGLNYGPLKNHKNLVFVGLEDEYNDLRPHIPTLIHNPVSDFLEMAKIIAGCKLFIGNQSFPYSLAEAMKKPRLLEIDPETPNVIPVGAAAHEILFQNQFEHIVKKILGA